MTAISGWFDLLTQSVSVAPYASRNAYGEDSYGAAVTYRARVVGKRSKVINAAGQEVVSDQTVYLGTANAVDPRSRVTLSTADAGSTEEYAIHPPIISTGRYPDENGNHHSVLFL